MEEAITPNNQEPISQVNIENYSTKRNISQLVLSREIDGSYFKSVMKSHKRIRIGSNISNTVKKNISFVSKLQLTQQLKQHNGCVNTIEWNSDGTLIVTGSDDCTVKVWAPSVNSSYLLRGTIQTGHFRNIFSAKFVPISGDKQIISCGMDGEVRWHDITKGCNEANSVLLGSFSYMVYKAFFLPQSDSNFLTTHQDGAVRLFDLRKNGAEAVTFLSDKGRISVNSLAFNPLNPNQFILGGADPCMRLHDVRYLINDQSTNIKSTCIAKFCPPTMNRKKGERFHITGVDFSAQNEAVATYSGDDVYLFDVNAPLDNNGLSTMVKQVYKGRRNVQTFLKEVSFLGNGAFVATGSDCGNLFIWEKDSGKLVQLLKADGSVVNGVAPHPSLPIVATCGIDQTGKIFEPGENITFVPKYAEKVQKKNANFKEEKPIMNVMQLLRLLRAIRGDQENEEGSSDSFAEEWMHTQQINQADETRTKANLLFQQGKYKEALDLYDDALEQLDFELEDEEEWDISEIETKRDNSRKLCLLNKAAALLKLNEYEEVIEICNEVLEKNPDELKALFRKGTAYMNLGKLNEAKSDLEKALSVSPSDVPIQKMLEDVKKMMEGNSKVEEQKGKEEFE